MKKLFLLPGLFLFVALSCQPYQVGAPVSTTEPDIRVLLKEMDSSGQITFDGRFTLLAEEAAYELGSRNNWLKTEVNQNGFRLSNPNRIFTFRDGDRIRFKPAETSARFRLGNNSYRGQLELTKSAGGALLLVNRLGLEQYLLGVVPSEMPATKEDYLNALKAQSVCARTYALKKMLERKKEPFDVYASTLDQVYKGADAERPLASRALRETHGDVLMYRDTLATVFYSSTCGGVSESVQNIWADKNFPYLQSGRDVVGPELACSVSPLFRWQRSFNLAQIDSLFKQNYGYNGLPANVSDTTEVAFSCQVDSRNASGRVTKLTLTFSDTTVQLQNFEIRRFFNLPPEGMLKSNLFRINKQGNHLLLLGGGFGHGVGMCQWGAINMSQKGFKYYDILVNKYFKGTYLKKVY